jgi:hypothetical protein
MMVDRETCSGCGRDAETFEETRLGIWVRSSTPVDTRSDTDLLVDGWACGGCGELYVSEAGFERLRGYIDDTRDEMTVIDLAWDGFDQRPVPVLWFNGAIEGGRLSAIDLESVALPEFDATAFTEWVTLDSSDERQKLEDSLRKVVQDMHIRRTKGWAPFVSSKDRGRLSDIKNNAETLADDLEQLPENVWEGVQSPAYWRRPDEDTPTLIDAFKRLGWSDASAFRWFSRLLLVGMLRRVAAIASFVVNETDNQKPRQDLDKPFELVTLAHGFRRVYDEFSPDESMPGVLDCRPSANDSEELDYELTANDRVKFVTEALEQYGEPRGERAVQKYLSEEDWPNSFNEDPINLRHP